MRIPILMAGILAVGAVALGACGGDSDDTVAAEPTQAPAATQVSAQTAAATVAPAAASADLVDLPAHFEGMGPTDTAQFNLKGGAFNFKIFHDGAEKVHRPTQERPGQSCVDSGRNGLSPRDRRLR